MTEESKIVEGREFGLAVVDLLGLNAREVLKVSLNSVSTEALSVDVRVMLSADDMAEIAYRMGGKL